MVGLVFHFEDNSKDVYSGRNLDIDAWIYAMKICSDIDRAIVVNSSSLSLKGLDRQFDWTVTPSIPPLEGNVVYLAAGNDPGVHENLWEFDHNVDWYVFGPASGWRGPQERSITVPSSHPSIALHSVHIASIVMAHRYHVKG